MDLKKLKIFIFILILMYFFFKKNNENFTFYSFSCISNNDFIYIKDINEIKNHLETDKFILTKSYECQKLLNLYDVIICDLKKKKNLNSLDITKYLDVQKNKSKFNYINNIFLSLKIELEKLINEISNLSNDVTLERYLNPNVNIIENIKNEFFMKYL